MFSILNICYSQIKSTGTIVLDNYMSFKIDLDNQNSKVYLTLSGPSDRWFSIGFNTHTMSQNTDCVVMMSETDLVDSYLPGGHQAPLSDLVNNWTVLSNTVTNNIRTISAMRNFQADSTDYLFTDLLQNIDIIWAYSYNPIFALYDPINSGHGGDNYGYINVSFELLDQNEFEIKHSKVDVFPNPAINEVHVYLNIDNQDPINLELLDSGYHYLQNRTITNKVNEIVFPVDCYAKGIYYLKVKTNSFEVLKKIIVN
jgi:hypothetical protein